VPAVLEETEMTASKAPMGRRVTKAATKPMSADSPTAIAMVESPAVYAHVAVRHRVVEVPLARAMAAGLGALVLRAAPAVTVQPPARLRMGPTPQWAVRAAFWGWAAFSDVDPSAVDSKVWSAAKASTPVTVTKETMASLDTMAIPGKQGARSGPAAGAFLVTIMSPRTDAWVDEADLAVAAVAAVVAVEPPVTVDAVFPMSAEAAAAAEVVDVAARAAWAAAVAVGPSVPGLCDPHRYSTSKRSEQVPVVVVAMVALVEMADWVV